MKPLTKTCIEPSGELHFCWVQPGVHSHLPGDSREVDLIPAIEDPAGGHWIWDSVAGKVLHNHPRALAEIMEQRLGGD